MKRLIQSIMISILLASCSTGSTSTMTSKMGDTSVTYYLDISNPKDDLFHVTVNVTGLTAENNEYQFAAVVPGTYRYLNFGRFVQSFSAYDADGKEVKTNKKGMNTYSISNPGMVRKIVYKMEDTFDSKVEGAEKIFPMGGTEVALDHASINTFGIFGFFKGLQELPLRLKLNLPSGWKIGTALTQTGGYYTATSYDHFADSPFFVGDLSLDSTRVAGIDVYFYTYAKSTNSTELLKMNKRILEAAGNFITYPAAPRYAFLVNLLNPSDTTQQNVFQGWGALEHSYSSFYVLPDFPQMKAQIPDIAAHEFFHVVTPLNIHSEKIEPFDFTKPNPSRHLWLYEGVTEWASDIMQLRNGDIQLQTYLNKLTNKIQNDIENYDATFSLEQLGLRSYDEDGGKQYGNIYERGAYVAALLDLKLLKLTNGTRGLREVIVDLSKEYGKNRTFKDDEFFDIFVKKTHPEIKQFIDDYIRGTKEFPIREYFSWVGVAHKDSVETPTLGIGIGLNPQRELYIVNMDPRHEKYGLKKGDVVKKVLGEALSMANAQAMLPKLQAVPIGGDIEFVVARDGKEINVTTKKLSKMDRHILTVDPNPTDAQKKLRDAWTTNLPMKSN